MAEIFGRFLDHSMTGEQQQVQMKEIAAAMRKAIAEQTVGRRTLEFDAKAPWTTFQLSVPHWPAAVPSPLEEACTITSGPALDQSIAAVSTAVKALAALCRQGTETVTIDGETIDLWDLKRDLRALLGPDPE